MPKISVIIPVYNSEKYLEKCLDSLVSQTMKDIEIIVVNDGSKDSSQKMIDNYVERYPTMIKSICQENAGQSAARNNGVSVATGEFVSFIDSDDYVDTNLLKKTYEYAVEKNLDIVCFGFWSVNGESFVEDDYIKIKGLSTEKTYLLFETSPWNKLIRRSLLVDNNITFTEGIIYEDLEMIPQLILYTDKIGYLNENLYYYVIHENSTMRQPLYNPKLQSIFTVMKTLRNKFEDTKYREELEYLHIEHLLHGAVLRLLCYEEGKEDIRKISDIMKKEFPLWRRNKYYKLFNWKYKTVCLLSYYKQIGLLKLLLGA